MACAHSGGRLQCQPAAQAGIDQPGHSISMVCPASRLSPSLGGRKAVPEKPALSPSSHLPIPAPQEEAPFKQYVIVTAGWW
ncbi:unnamed protein product [Effrenium voratum]|uniref:Uncharacterized protein n=1 Tax=Effrenium voratum TaxID=2562239 RepID=A0AA36NJ13_9DINO|nr:unnamed protein product [Effrenium voratum]